MIRFAWLQFRVQAAIVFGGLAVVAIILAITGPHLVHLYDTNVATCATHGDCSTAASAFLQNDRTLQILLDALVVVVPGIIGVFWGAPLVARELESGTFRLVWTQSVTRARWAALKLGVVGLASIAAAGLLSLMVTWWSSPIDRANASLYTSFDQRGIVPLGYAVFAFVLGVFSGVLIRRTLPAMATTLAGFVATRLLFNHFVLPKLMAPTQLSFALNQQTVQGYGQMNGGPFTLFAGNPNIPNAWFYSTQFVDRAGHPLSSQVLTSACPLLPRGPGPGGPAGVGVHSAIPVPGGGGRTALQDCITKLGTTYHELVAFQPASRYWSFQWFELAIYLGVALVLAGSCIWWIRRRLS
jgi:ABC-type transport system involved in multi-copper enzyme maturation permease subunit